MKITTEIVKMTPERAGRILEGNRKNRKVKPNHAKNLSRQMKDGLWRFDGSAIRVDSDGNLIDGQHRLYAVVDSGETVDMLLITGLDPEVMSTIDTGVSRSFADVLKITDPELTDAAAVAATVRLVYKYKQGARGDDLFATGARVARAKFGLDHQTLLKDFQDNRAEYIYLSKASRSLYWAHSLKGVGAPVLALALYIFEGIDRDDARDFFSKVRTGADMQLGHPILTLKKFTDRVAAQRDTNPRGDVFLAVIIKAWNKYRAGETWTNASYRKGGSQAEAFPEAK